MTTKHCGTCETVKSRSDFYRSSRSKDGLQYHCKKCANRKRREWAKLNPERHAEWNRASYLRITPEQRAESKLRKEFKLSLADYEAMLVQQGGGCAICGAPPPPDRRLQVDHDHSCCNTRYTCGGCVRGLLCLNCNAALGHVRDNKETLVKMIEYLDGAPGQCPPQFAKRG